MKAYGDLNFKGGNVDMGGGLVTNSPSIGLPMRPVTVAEYNALSDDDKDADVIYAIEDENEDFPPSWVNGFMPVGAILPYMGTKAPKNYLICDGAEYEIGDYPALARQITEEFGAVNYYGGNGVTTFAVPDLRNQFLRGYHGDAAEQLSGEIGRRQEATKMPGYILEGGPEFKVVDFGFDPSCLTEDNHNINPIENPDSAVTATSRFDYHHDYFGGDVWSDKIYSSFTARPVNTAVLLCIRCR